MTRRLAFAVLSAGAALLAHPALSQPADVKLDAVRAERDLRAAEAGRLADEIARLKASTQGPRAGRELEQQLRAFDRVVLSLDGLDRRLARLTDAPGPVPGTGLDPADLRPLLDIVLEAGDRGAMLDTKLALLRAEQARGGAQAARLERALQVLSVRLEAAQRQAREAESARRDAGPGLPLLQREADTLKLRVREIGAGRDLVALRRAKLAGERTLIEQRLAEAERRLREGAGSTTE